MVAVPELEDHNVPKHLGYDELLELARDKSRAGRATLVDAIKDFHEGSQTVITAKDRALFGEILQALILDVEVAVRANLAAYFADRTDAPEDLVRALANDEIAVAYPILVKSELLKDPELIEIIAHRAMEHHLAIALRPQVSENVSDALVATSNGKVVNTLLNNPGARLSKSTMTKLVELSAANAAYQKPLANRHDLPPDLAKRLYWGVSAALREHLVRRFKIDPTELDGHIVTAIQDAVAKHEAAAGRPAGPAPGHQRDGSGGVRTFVDLLRRGEVEQFIHVLTKLTNLRTTLVRRILFEQGGEGLAVICTAIGVDLADFLTIFTLFRQGRLGDQCVASDEIGRAIEFYNGTNEASAKRVLTHWNQDSDYLNALRLVRQIGS